ncbi:unnamed protein product [marine sediment metagenome]|uniref:HicB-like antitoxin of toxin-antitoxin system domain-containing protein n=1 Tax=marine sediment metagenome TaxID=412755 RepID=X0X2R4_9ZZZZ
MKIVAVKDVESGGYTAFHAQFPSVVVEAETLEEVKENLSNTFHDIMMGAEIEEHDLKR